MQIIFVTCNVFITLTIVENRFNRRNSYTVVDNFNTKKKNKILIHL